MKVAVHISQESLSSLNVAVYISQVVLRRKQFKN